MFASLLALLDAPLKLTKRWRRNHEEDQMMDHMRHQVIESSLSSALDLSFSPPPSSNTSIVNWLNQNPGIVAHTSPPNSPSTSSRMSYPEVSPPSSITSSEEPFSCLYLLASAAVGELERQRLKSNSVQNLALTV